MIKSIKELKNYIFRDFEAQNMSQPLLAMLTYGENYAMFSYMKTLRLLEYFEFKRTKNKIYVPLYYYFLLKFRRKCLKSHIHIHPNVVGPGFAMIHPGFRRFGEHMKVGCNCVVLPNVLLGRKSPDIRWNDYIIEVGDDCYIGTGSVILGPVKIGSNVTIGAGAVVTKDFPDNVVIAGNPAKIIRYK
jgi:serine O-acetyltransferase